METDTSYAFEGTVRGQPIPATGARDADDSFLDDFVHQKTKLLRTKLEVLAAEVLLRLDVSNRNQQGLDCDRETVRVMLEKLDRQTRYHLREQRDKDVLYRQMFELQQAKRDESVECWKDIVMVMRDFLYIWDAHEQAKSRGRFLQDAGQ